MSAFTYLPKPKPNQNGTVRQAETVHELDYIFSVSVAEFQQIPQVILSKYAHTQPCGLLITMLS